MAPSESDRPLLNQHEEGILQRTFGLISPEYYLDDKIEAHLMSRISRDPLPMMEGDEVENFFIALQMEQLTSKRKRQLEAQRNDTEMRKRYRVQVPMRARDNKEAGNGEKKPKESAAIFKLPVHYRVVNASEGHGKKEQKKDGPIANRVENRAVQTNKK